MFSFFYKKLLFVCWVWFFFSFWSHSFQFSSSLFIVDRLLKVFIEISLPSSVINISIWNTDTQECCMKFSMNIWVIKLLVYMKTFGCNKYRFMIQEGRGVFYYLVIYKMLKTRLPSHFCSFSEAQASSNKHINTLEFYYFYVPERFLPLGHFK